MRDSFRLSGSNRGTSCLLTVCMLNFGYNRGVVPAGRALPVYQPRTKQVSLLLVLLVRD